MGVDPLDQVDEALVGLRRLFAGIPADTRVAAGSPVELSTALVVDAVERGGSASAGPTVADVAIALQVAPSTASRLVERAVAAGMVTKRASAEDARRLVLGLTAAGSRLLRTSRRHRRRYLGQRLADWDQREVATFAVLLHRFAQSVAEQPPGAAGRRKP